MEYTYKDKQYELFTGPKGGTYIIVNNKKKYVKATQKPIKHYCCCCGKELNTSDMNYYDLTDYCPKCALADGIITSLE